MDSLLQPSDFALIFEKTPEPYLILDPAFRVVAQNDAHARVTMTSPDRTIGHLLFEIFPDNPDDANAQGLAELRQSLVTVLKTRAPDTIPSLKFDIAGPSGDEENFEVRYWRVTNTPILGEDGFVRLIINRAIDLTALV